MGKLKFVTKMTFSHFLLRRIPKSLKSRGELKLFKNGKLQDGEFKLKRVTFFRK